MIDWDRVLLVVVIPYVCLAVVVGKHPGETDDIQILLALGLRIARGHTKFQGSGSVVTLYLLSKVVGYYAVAHGD